MRFHTFFALICTASVLGGTFAVPGPAQHQQRPRPRQISNVKEELNNGVSYITIIYKFSLSIDI
jgi:hypothetical protein